MCSKVMPAGSEVEDRRDLMDHIFQLLVIAGFYQVVCGPQLFTVFHVFDPPGGTPHDFGQALITGVRGEMAQHIGTIEIGHLIVEDEDDGQFGRLFEKLQHSFAASGVLDVIAGNIPDKGFGKNIQVVLVVIYN